MPSNIEIRLTADTNSFEAGLRRVNDAFERFAYRGDDAAKSIDRSLKELNKKGKQELDQFQKSLNSLGAKSDLTLDIKTESIVRAKHFYLQQFLEIRDNARSSAAEIARAWEGMQQRIEALSATPMSKAHAEAMEMNQKFNYDRQRQEVKMYEDALSMNQKFNYDRRIQNERMRAEETARYAAAAMRDDAAAARLIGQSQAGSEFSRQLRQQMEETSQAVKKTTNEFNLLSLASIASIAKIQILYSLVNTVMSAIGSIPRTAVAAIEDYNAAIVKNAALITSMQTGIKDIGAQYRDNKRYATELQEVMIRIDAESTASARQLGLMNEQFIQQGVILNVNNRAQIEGYRNLANAIATISQGDPNQDLQFSQETGALMRGENRPGNRLFRMLNALDNGKLEEHLKLWQQTAKETGNYGYVLEKIGPMLSGFAAAQGDINGMWQTVKSTMTTIRDEVLRGGLAPGFAEIVKWMKQITEEARNNKEKVQAFLAEGFGNAKAVASVLWDIGKGVAYLAQPLMWGAIAAGIASITAGMRAFAASVTISTGGVNLLVGALAAAGIKAQMKINENSLLEERAKNINASGMMGLNATGLESILKAFPAATDEEIIRWKRLGGIRMTGTSAISGQQQISIDRDRIKFIRSEYGEQAPYPKNLNIGGDAKKIADAAKDADKAIKEFETAWRRLENESEESGFVRKLQKINEETVQIVHLFEEAQKSETGRARLAAEGITRQTIEQNNLARVQRAVNEEASRNAERLRREQNEEITKYNQLIDVIDKWKQQAEPNPFAVKIAGLNRELDEALRKFRELSEEGRKGLVEKDFFDAADAFKKKAADNYAFDQTTRDINFLNAQTGKSMSAFGGGGYAGDMFSVQTGYNSEAREIKRLIDDIQSYKDKYQKDYDSGLMTDEATKEYAKKLLDQEKYQQQSLALKKAFEDQQLSIGMKAASDSLSILQQQFADNKAASIAFLAVQKSIAIAQILIATEIAAAGVIASKALLPGGAEAGLVEANAIRAMGYVSMGLVAASGFAEAAGILSGKRADGGPVTAGGSYLIGERGPEIFTPSVSGMITANEKIGGMSINQNISIDARGADAGAETRIRAALERNKQETIAAVYNSMNRGSAMAVASGRR